MKKSILMSSFIALFSLGVNITVNGQASVDPPNPPCNICDETTEDECSRTITPSGPHIFYGKLSPCQD